VKIKLNYQDLEGLDSAVGTFEGVDGVLVLADGLPVYAVEARDVQHPTNFEIGGMTGQTSLQMRESDEEITRQEEKVLTFLRDLVTKVRAKVENRRAARLEQIQIAEESEKIQAAGRLDNYIVTGARGDDE